MRNNTTQCPYCYGLDTAALLPPEENFNMVCRSCRGRFGIFPIPKGTPTSLLGGFLGPEMDVVDRPAHYTDGKIEVIDFIEDKKLDFHLGNVVKYVARAGKKNPANFLEDLKKARWYLNRFIEKAEGVSHEFEK